MIYKANDQSQPSTWGVVTTCREPTQLMLAFVAHHIAAGASRIYLYLDAPQPDLEAQLAQVPQVEVTLCDETYWRDHIGRKRPGRQEFRQLINAFDAYDKTDLAWLAHIDADEFLHSDMLMADILAAQPDGLDYVVVNVRERAYLAETPQQGIFDGVFRRPLSPEWEDPSILLNEGERFTRRGVLGYPHGKSFMRTGQWMVPGIHTPRRQREKRDIPLN
ncbi:MAG: glycosyltransferase family 2 protein, partial [Sulfitobacter sp.]|nr:glycosyltransferase family 2 protein [Sulfitobacter sp.]